MNRDPSTNIPTGPPVSEVLNHLSSQQKEGPQNDPDNTVSEKTADLYLKLWSYFQSWCTTNGVTDKPADPDNVVKYMTERARHVKNATLNITSAAIKFYHEQDGLLSPTLYPQVRAALRDLARKYPYETQKVTAIDDDTFALIKAAAHHPKDGESEEYANRRATFDIALIALMREAKLSRGEAARSQWQHIHRLPDGPYILEIPSTKSNLNAQPEFAFISLSTIQSLAAMLQLRPGTRPKPKPKDTIFRIGEEQIANRIKAAAKHAGLDTRFGGHSPRAGTTMDPKLRDVSTADLISAGRWSAENAPTVEDRKIKVSTDAIMRWYETNYPTAEPDTI